MKYGYIYIRINKYWDFDNACKLGETFSIPNRNDTYITCEIIKGKFILVIRIDANILIKVEKQLIKHFTKLGYHVHENGGIEFFNKNIIELIIPYFMENNIDHYVLSDEEIEALIRNKKNNLENDDDVCVDDEITITDTLSSSSNNLDNEEEKITFIPRDYQEIIINKSYEYFQQNNKGLLVIPCGVGKTLLSLWIAYKLNSMSIIIGVPNILLLQQWKKTITHLFNNEYKCFIVCSGVNKNDIQNFIENCKHKQQKFIIITTYASSYKLVKIINKINLENENNEKTKFSFDMLINDECHHLTSTNINIDEETQKYINMLNITTNKQLSLTATTKELLETVNTNDNNNNKSKVISNTNIEHFGNIIEKKSLLWAIEKDIVCDYLIQTIVTDRHKLNKIADEYNEYNNKFDINNEDDKRLFLSAFASLKSIESNNSNHILIYSNNINNSKKIIEFIEFFIEHEYFTLRDKPYCNVYHGSMNKPEKKNVLQDFENNRYGIISCVYCLGEGYDFPMLDGVVFSENMTSNIRIVQSALRPCRKYALEPNKVAKIIIPMLNDNSSNNWLDNNEPDYKKIRNIIYELGTEDKTISEKIHVCKIDMDKPKKDNDEKGKNDKKKNKANNNIEELNENVFEKYNIELTKELKLHTISRLDWGISYTKAIKIIRGCEPKIRNKTEYYALCDKDVRLSKEPEQSFKNQFTNWFEYLTLNKDELYNLQECKKEIKKYIGEHSELKNKQLDLHAIACELFEHDNKFPPIELWVDCYTIEDKNIKTLGDIINIRTKKKNKSCI
jgi:superfamily II DNA or RNA helicase